MKILTRENVVLFYGEVEKGVFPEADATRELYKINGNQYSVTDDIIEYDVESVPEDFVQGKYCYTEEDGFYLNSDYVEAEPQNQVMEEQLKEALTEIAQLKAELAQVQSMVANTVANN